MQLFQGINISESHYHILPRPLLHPAVKINKQEHCLGRHSRGQRRFSGPPEAHLARSASCARWGADKTADPWTASPASWLIGSRSPDGCPPPVTTECTAPGPREAGGTCRCSVRPLECHHPPRRRRHRCCASAGSRSADCPRSCQSRCCRCWQDCRCHHWLWDVLAQAPEDVCQRHRWRR